MFRFALKNNFIYKYIRNIFKQKIKTKTALIIAMTEHWLVVIGDVG